MNIPFINDYKWHELMQAYGTAEESPAWLIDLVSDDEDTRTEAINDFLLSQVCHQYTTYSCTPPVVKCVIYILNNHNYEDNEALADVIGFIDACTYGARAEVLLKNEILEGISCFLNYHRHEHPRVREYSDKLIKFCSEFGVYGS